MRNHKTDIQAFKPTDKCFKMRKQEELYFLSELFIKWAWNKNNSTRGGKVLYQIQILCLHQKSNYIALISAIVKIGGFLHKTIMSEQISKLLDTESYCYKWDQYSYQVLNNLASDMNWQSWHTATSTPDFLTEKEDATERLLPYFRKNK